MGRKSGEDFGGVAIAAHKLASGVWEEENMRKGKGEEGEKPLLTILENS
jgi:hypothetical protein